jgi:hypothetical protein
MDGGRGERARYVKILYIRSSQNTDTEYRIQKTKYRIQKLEYIKLLMYLFFIWQ